MFNILISLLIWGQILIAPPSATGLATCDCPAISNIQKSGQTSSSISYTWEGPDGATAYRVWYYCQERNFTSSASTIGSGAHTFSGLAPGHYTFYFETVCGTEASSVVGVEDLINL